jgi:hypothetical protein
MIISSRQEKNRALYPIIMGALQNCLREVLVRHSRGNSRTKAGLMGETKKICSRSHMTSKKNESMGDTGRSFPVLIVFPLRRY